MATKRTMIVTASTTAILAAIYIGINFVMPSTAANQTSYMLKSMEIQQCATDALECLINCETSYRGYLLTLNPNFLEPMQMCFANIEGQLDKLDNLTKSNPEEQKLIPLMRDEARKKIDISRKVANMKDANRSDLTYWMSRGKEIMDSYRINTARLRERETDILRDATIMREQLRAWIQVVRLVFSILIMSSLLFLLIQIIHMPSDRKEEDA